MTTVVIMGNSLSANLAAAYIKKNNPQFEIVIIGPETVTNPIVGESLIEASTEFFFDIGLGSYLEKEHFHKYSLSFYYKEHLNNPEDRRYAVHEGLSIPPMPSFQINRFTLIKKLINMNRDSGVRYIHSLVKNVNTLHYRQHVVTYGEKEESSVINADWVIDTTGRRRLLSRQHNLLKPAPVQRCAYWFRLENFDRDFLNKITMVKHFHKNYDYYYCTHHFFGVGNWIWLIPIKSEDNRDLISIGITWRPDLYPHSIKSVEDFCEYVAKEHPAVTDLVKSGDIVDVNHYNNYFYQSAKLYSPEGWFIIADAGNTVDPLYSPGISFTTLQIHQVNAMLQRAEHTALDAEYVKILEDCHQASFYTMQDTVARQYEGMHDPYQMHVYVHAIATAYYHFLLPCWLARYHTEPMGAKFLTKITNKAQEAIASLYELIVDASKQVGPVPSEKIFNYVRWTINDKLWGSDEANIAKHISRMLVIFVYHRFRVLRHAHWKNASKHMKIIFADLFKAVIFRTVFHKKPLRKSFLIKLFLKGKIEFQLPMILKERRQSMSANVTEGDF